MKKIDVTKLRKKSVRNIGLWIVMGGAAVITIVGSVVVALNQMWAWVVFFLGLLISLVGVGVTDLAQRCPHCGGHLGGGPKSFCPNCGENVRMWHDT